MRRTPILALAIGALTVSMTVVAPSALAAPAPVAPASPSPGSDSSVQPTFTSSSQPLQDLGTVNLANIAGSTSSPPTGTSSHGHPAATPLGRPPALSLTGKGKPVSAGSFSVQTGNVVGERGFDGISGPAQAAVNGGVGAGDLEPPDQGTCVGPGTDGQPVVMEIINNAVAAYTPAGTQLLGVTPTTALFNQPSTAFLSDPRCYYDASTQRWFFTEFIVGFSGPPSTQFVAVSKSSDPFGDYQVFGTDTTDAANTSAECPCFGDFDQIGADANGFYITTNEFSVAGAGYGGTVIYAMSKQGLEAAANGAPLPSVARYQVTADAFGPGPYHVSPASTPPGGGFAPNTEYFVESNSNLFSDNHLLVYALTGTDSLASGGVPPLVSTQVTTQPYAFPPDASQRSGTLTLGGQLNYTTPSPLMTDFDAVQEVTYTSGRLYAELDTAANPSAPTAAVAWFAMAPTSTGDAVSATVVKQGYVANSQNLLYPHIVVDAAGNGFINFTLSGPAYFPSAAYVSFYANSGAVGTIHLAATGNGPEDGFSCYPEFYPPGAFPGGCRWGDYSGGAVWGGRAYMMTEYIPATGRDYYTNWGTYVWSAPVP
jgi:hypothetical protein